MINFIWIFEEKKFQSKEKWNNNKYCNMNTFFSFDLFYAIMVYIYQNVSNI